MRCPIAAFALMAALATAPAFAQEDEVHPLADVKTARLTFSEAVFGWCAEQVTGSTFVPSKLDPMNADWQAEPAPSKGLAVARVHKATGVIVELKSDRSSCYVQVDALGGNVLALALRGLLVRPPMNGVTVRDFKNASGHGAAYAVRHGHDGPVSVISINEYNDRPKLVTAVVERDPDAAGTGAK